MASPFGFPIVGSDFDVSEFVYHYTTRDVALQFILSGRSLRLGSLTKTRDPRESRKWAFGMAWTEEGDPIPEDEERIELMRIGNMLDTAPTLIQQNCKILCTTRDDPLFDRGDFNDFKRGYAHSRMWDQYAEGHRGVCLVFRRDELHQSIVNTVGDRCILYEGPVEYSDGSPQQVMAFSFQKKEVLQHGFMRYLELQRERYYRVYFFTKAEDWSQEFEYRWVAIGSDDNPEYVSIDSSIAGVVVGVDFPEVYIPSVTPFCRDFGIDLVRIGWKNGTPRLKKRYKTSS